MSVIGVFEAENTLDHWLDRVERGEEVAITRHGREVARLVPAKRDAARQAAQRIRAMSRGVTLGGPNARDLIDEGRR